jgi:hypothetical protein
MIDMSLQFLKWFENIGSHLKCRILNYSIKDYKFIKKLEQTRDFINYSYPLTVDHSQDFEIHTTKDGKVFGIKNLRITETGIKADISGDVVSAHNYLKDYVEKLKEIVIHG